MYVCGGLLTYVFFLCRGCNKCKVLAGPLMVMMKAANACEHTIADPVVLVVIEAKRDII